MTTQHAQTSQIWEQIGAPEGGSITALALGQTIEGSTLYIGTKVGLYRSLDFVNDAAQRWEKLRAAPLGVMALAVSPDYAHDHTVIIGTDVGIFVSRNAGDTWLTAQIPMSRSMVLTLCFSPNFAEDGIILAGTLEDGVWQSQNRGETWAARSFGLLDATILSLVAAPDFAGNERLYAGTDTAIYYSYNGGRAWKQIGFPDDAAPALSLMLSPDYASDRTIYAGTEHAGLLRSTDGGARWNKLSLPANSINALQMTRQSLIAATEVGIFLSQDRGDTWVCLLENPDTICLAARDDIVVAGSVDQGAWISSNLTDWNQMLLPPIRTMVGMAFSPEFANDRVAFMFGPQEGIWRTLDGGTTWQLLHEGLPSLDAQALIVSPNFHADHIAVTTTPEGVFISHDAGEQWRLLLEQAAVAVAISPDGRYLAVALDGAGIQVTDDLGQTWESVAGPWDEGGRVVTLAISAERELHVALLEGVADALSIWQGAEGHVRKVVSHPATQNAVVAFAVPQRELSACWYAALGNRVWRIGFDDATQTTESHLPTEAEGIIALSFSGNLIACTGQHVYGLHHSTGWEAKHYFGDEIAVAFALSPDSAPKRAFFVLLLGGMLCRGEV